MGASCWDGCVELLCGMGSPRWSWGEDLGLRVWWGAAHHLGWWPIHLNPPRMVGRGGLWVGLVERRGADDWVSASGSFEVAGGVGGGGPRVAWRARLDGGVGDIGLGPGVAVDRGR